VFAADPGGICHVLAIVKLRSIRTYYCYALCRSGTLTYAVHACELHAVCLLSRRDLHRHHCCDSTVLLLNQRPATWYLLQCALCRSLSTKTDASMELAVN